MVKTFFNKEHQKISYLTFIFIVLALILIFNIIFFTEYTSALYVQRDGWRFIDIYLIPYYNGEVTLKTLFSDPVHSQPIVAILQIVNAELFSLNMKYESYFGLFFIIVTTLLILKLLLNNLVEFSLFFKCILSLCVIGILLSIGSIEKVTWSLLTLSYIPTFFVIIISIYFDKSIKNNIFIKNKLYLFILLIILFLIQKDSGILITGALIICLFLKYFFDLKKYFFFVCGFLIVFILFKLFVSYLDISTLPQTAMNPINSVFIVFNNPLTFFHSLSVTFLSPLINFEYVVDNKLLTSEQYIFLSYIPFGLSMFIVYFFVKHKLYIKISIVPLVIFVYSLLFIIAVILFRYPPIDQNSIYLVSSLRYITVYELMIVSILWMAGILYSYGQFSQNKNSIKLFILIIFIIFLLTLYNTLMSWNKGYYVNLNNKNVIQSLTQYKTDTVYPPWVSTNGKIKESHIEFLKSNNLNVFNEKNIQ